MITIQQVSSHDKWVLIYQTSDSPSSDTRGEKIIILFMRLIHNYLHQDDDHLEHGKHECLSTERKCNHITLSSLLMLKGKTEETQVCALNSN